MVKRSSIRVALTQSPRKKIVAAIDFKQKLIAMTEMEIASLRAELSALAASTELWKPVDGAPKFSVSNWGRVESRVRERPRIIGEKVQRNRGERWVTITCDDGRSIQTSVANLMATHWPDVPFHGDAVRIRRRDE